MNNSKALSLIKNAFILPAYTNPGRNGNIRPVSVFNKNAGGSNDINKNLSNYFLPVSPVREAEDPKSWRDSIIEAEAAVFPHRVKMQEIFRDTMLDSHVRACVNKRRNLTLLRKFVLCDDAGVPDIEATKMLQKSWFTSFLSYVLDAKFFGYSLISLGNIINSNFPEVTIIRRDNISPERHNVTSVPYMIDGLDWRDSPYNEWHIWVDTPSEDGTTACGLGLFYYIALIAIRLRNMSNDNADYMEMFAAPLRVLNMEDKNNEEERSQAEQSLRMQASMGYTIIGKEDKLEYLNGSGGAGYKSYADADQRWKKDISKVILGHSDAIDSTPGKLGGGQSGGGKGGDHSPVMQAFYELQQSDANYIEPIVNEELLTRMRWHGINIPDNLHFKFLNSEEDDYIKEKQMEENVNLSIVAANLAKAYQTIDKEYWENSTGIILSDKTIEPAENNN